MFNSDDAVNTALAIISLEEFSLATKTNDNGDRVFVLYDFQGANLGNIENEEFYTLGAVLDRLDIYHRDYIEPSEEADDPGVPEYCEFLKNDEAIGYLSDFTAYQYDKKMFIEKINFMSLEHQIELVNACIDDSVGHVYAFGGSAEDDTVFHRITPACDDDGYRLFNEDNGCPVFNLGDNDFEDSFIVIHDYVDFNEFSNWAIKSREGQEVLPDILESIVSRENKFVERHPFMDRISMDGLHRALERFSEDGGFGRCGDWSVIYLQENRRSFISDSLLRIEYKNRPLAVCHNSQFGDLYRHAGVSDKVFSEICDMVHSACPEYHMAASEQHDIKNRDIAFGR